MPVGPLFALLIRAPAAWRALTTEIVRKTLPLVLCAVDETGRAAFALNWGRCSCELIAEITTVTPRRPTMASSGGK